ncbi:MAG: hypothetical protein IJM35_10950 [Bacteroidales bacterium]|nr:hypothetical protein [Bacteroidales bacterium]
MNAAVVIPVYLSELSEEEKISFNQTVKVLGRHDIILVCPCGFDHSNYDNLAAQQGVTIKKECFEASYFNGIPGYNRLLLSRHFYERFSNYNYILICQLDVFVFRDELEYWCTRGYDFIGAPIIGKFEDTAFSNVMRVGNGGFSLRKISSYLAYFNSGKNVIPTNDIAHRISLRKKPYTRIFVWILMSLGWRNKPVSFAAHWRYNEDDFWSGVLDKSNFALRKPSPEEAMLFSFERFPSELFKLTGNKLPFGCHAWKKYEFNGFWRHIIPQADSENTI